MGRHKQLAVETLHPRQQRDPCCPHLWDVERVLSHTLYEWFWGYEFT